jgi:hypothetical protein
MKQHHKHNFLTMKLDYECYTELQLRENIFPTNRVTLNINFLLKLDFECYTELQLRENIFPTNSYIKDTLFLIICVVNTIK